MGLIPRSVPFLGKVCRLQAPRAATLLNSQQGGAQQPTGVRFTPDFQLFLTENTSVSLRATGPTWYFLIETQDIHVL